MVSPEFISRPGNQATTTKKKGEAFSYWDNNFASFWSTSEIMTRKLNQLSIKQLLLSY